MLKAETTHKERLSCSSYITKWALIAASLNCLAGAPSIWTLESYSQSELDNQEVQKNLEWARIKKPVSRQSSKLVPKAVKIVRTSAKSMELRIVKGEVFKNDTFTKLLLQERVDSKTIFEIVRAARPIINLNKIQTGNPYRFVFDRNDQILYLDYSLDAKKYLRIKRVGSSFSPILLDIHYEIETEVLKGEIKNNLISEIFLFILFLFCNTLLHFLII